MKRSRLFLLIAVFAVFLLTNAVSAALDLGVDEITLDPGGFYEFTPQDGIVYWYVSDESVIELGGEETMGVKALEPGTAVVFAMSEDRSEADSCVVKVTGEAKAVKSGDLYYQDLTEEDLAKVNDPAIAAVLSMASNTAAFPMGIGDLSGHEYKVLVMVKDGSQQKIADAAEAMGLDDVWAYKYVSMAALKGDANDIARLLVEYRDDIVSVETDREYSVDSLEDDGIFNLNATAEKLSEVKVAHALGYTGEGQYVAIIDSGVATRHKEFWTAEENADDRTYRVAYEHCYSSSQEPTETTITKDGKIQTVYEQWNSVCENNAPEADSAIPYTSSDASKEYFQHGTHVAGIAVGTYRGVAPDAQLIAVQAFTERVWYDQNADGTGYDPNTAVYGMTMSNSDEAKALDYILGLINNENIEIASLNMSYGSGAYADVDTSYDNGSLLEKIWNKGTVLCAASGNDLLNGEIRTPAASPYVFAVGALAENTTPTVAVFSNHSELVDILAPGTNIKSSIYYDSDTGDNCYGYNTGTSMATPMVSGAFALLKQVGNWTTAEELEQEIVNMTDKSAARAGVSTPVLNFAGFSKYVLSTPYENTDYEVAGGNGTITVTTAAVEEDPDNPDPNAFAGYKVELCKEDGTVLKTQYAAADQKRTLSFTGLANNTLYKVKVYGYVLINGTKYYSDCRITPMVPMAVPTGLVLTLEDSTTVKAAWKNHSNDAISVECATDQNFGESFDTCNGLGSCTITNLAPNMTYYFRFQSVYNWHDDENNSDYSFESPASAVSAFCIPSEPSNGLDFSVSTGNRSILVTLVPNDNYDGYKVEIYNPGTNKVVVARTQAVTTKNIPLNVTGLTNDTKYDVRVYGYKTVNRVNYFSVYTAEEGVVPMAVPTGIVLTAAGTDSATVTWPKNESNKISVEYSTAQNGEYTTVCDQASVPCSVTGLNPDTTYYFRFRRYNETLEYYSPYSAVSTFRIPSEPTSGTHYTVTNGNRIITVNLKKDANANYDGYKVEIYNPDTKKVVAARTQAVTKDIPITFSGLTNDTVYEVRVYGYKTVNRVNYFSVCTKSTKMAPMTVPTGLDLKVDNTSLIVTASWPAYTDRRIKVEYSTDNVNYVTYCEVEHSSTCAGTALNKDTVYSFRFSWLNESCGVYSPVSAVTTKLILNKPTYTTHYTVDNGNRIITVTLKPAAAIYTGYKVDIYNPDTQKVVATRTQAVTTKNIPLTFSGLTNDTVYEVRVYGYKTVNRVNYFSDEYAMTKMAPMTVPTGLNLDVTVDSVTASWTGHDAKINVEYAEQNGTYKTVCDKDDTAPCTISNLDANTVYSFHFRWYSEECGVYSPWSAVTTVMTIAEPVQKEEPMVGYRKIRVYFDDDVNLTGHQIKTYIASTNKLVSTVNVKRTTNPEFADITNLTNGTEYRFEIRAYAINGRQTFYSNALEVKAVLQLKPLDDDYPQDVTASGGAKKITVSWTKDTWTGGHYIEVYRMDNSVMAANAYVANNATSYTFSGGNIEYDVSYMVRVWKFNERSPKAVGNSYEDTYAISLATPGAFNAVTADKSINVTWTYSGIAENVEVYYSSVSNKGPFEDQPVVCKADNSAEACTITDLENGKVYYVKAAAVYELQTLPFSSVETAVKTAAPLPVMNASAVTVTPGSKSVTVSYTKDTNVDGHTIQLYRKNGAKWQLVKTQTADNAKISGDKVEVKFTGLVNDTAYQVTISSYKKIDRTTYRGAIYVTTEDIIPNENSSSASKDIIGVTEMTEPFDGFVDPVEEFNAESEAEEAVDVEVKEEEKKPSVFDLFRL